MCYLEEPTQITVESDQLLFYVDTATTLELGSEIHSVEISPFIINTIPDPTAI